MNKEKKSNKKAVHFESRSQKLVTCPYCWTDQRAERDHCYRCGAEFLYLDELIICRIYSYCRAFSIVHHGIFLPACSIR